MLKKATNMRNIEKIKQKPLNELIDWLTNQLPQLKLDLQILGKQSQNLNEKKIIEIFKQHMSDCKDYELKIIWEIIVKRIKKEHNKDINKL